MAHPAVDLCVTKTGGGQVQRSFSCPWPGAGYPRVVFRIRVVQPDHPERAALAAGPFTRPRRTAIRKARSESDLPEPGRGEGSGCPGGLLGATPACAEHGVQIFVWTVCFVHFFRQRPQISGSCLKKHWKTPVIFVRKSHGRAFFRQESTNTTSGRRYHGLSLLFFSSTPKIRGLDENIVWNRGHGRKSNFYGCRHDLPCPPASPPHVPQLLQHRSTRRGNSLRC